MTGRRGVDRALATPRIARIGRLDRWLIDREDALRSGTDADPFPQAWWDFTLPWTVEEQSLGGGTPTNAVNGDPMDGDLWDGDSEDGESEVELGFDDLEFAERAARLAKAHARAGTAHARRAVRRRVRRQVRRLDPVRRARARARRRERKRERERVRRRVEQAARRAAWRTRLTRGWWS